MTNIARDAKKLKLSAATDPAATPPTMLRKPMPAQASQVQYTPILISAQASEKNVGHPAAEARHEPEGVASFSPHVIVAATINAAMRAGSVFDAAIAVEDDTRGGMTVAHGPTQRAARQCCVTTTPGRQRSITVRAQKLQVRFEDLVRHGRRLWPRAAGDGWTAERMYR